MAKGDDGIIVRRRRAVTSRHHLLQSRRRSTIVLEATAGISRVGLTADGSRYKGPRRLRHRREAFEGCGEQRMTRVPPTRAAGVLLSSPRKDATDRKTEEACHEPGLFLRSHTGSDRPCPLLSASWDRRSRGGAPWLCRGDKVHPRQSAPFARRRGSGGEVGYEKKKVPLQIVRRRAGRPGASWLAPPFRARHRRGVAPRNPILQRRPATLPAARQSPSLRGAIADVSSTAGRDS
jgi:hypothetical protein